MTAFTFCFQFQRAPLHLGRVGRSYPVAAGAGGEGAGAAESYALVHVRVIVGVGAGSHP